MKQRLDQLVQAQGLAETRTKAQALIMAGQIMIGTKPATKPGMLVDDASTLTLKATSVYVSRGGDKLASVAAKLGLDFSCKIVLDAGSSTGGFSDYALQNGATKIYAVDVGTGQLAWKLRQNPYVQVMEQTDIRTASLDQPADIAVADLSFISLTKVLPAIARLVRPGGQIVAMVKPQFEAGKDVADRFKGVISDSHVRADILGNFEAAIEPDFNIVASADSGLSGSHGNLERFYLLTAKNPE